MRKHLLTLAVLAFSLPLTAQDSLQVTTLREVVVSASRSEQPVIEIPRSVTVIHEDVLQRSIYQSLGELLNAQSSLYVVGANQTPGANQNLFLRGAGSNQVAILVDGVRITDPSTPNAAMDLSEISLANIERVEIIRGSHSTMYGGAAIGGVINLITKKNAAGGFHGNVSLQGGAFSRSAGALIETAHLRYGMKNGMYVSGSAFRQDVKGLNSTEGSGVNRSFTADADDFRKTDFTLKTGYSRGAWDANVSFRNTHQYTEIDDGAFYDDDNSYLVFDRQVLQYHAARKVNAFMNITLLGAFHASERFYEDDSSKVDPVHYDRTYSTGSYTGRLQTHELQLNFNGRHLNGVVGGGLYAENMFFDNYFLLNDPSYRYEYVVDYDTLDTRTTTRYIFSQAAYRTGGLELSAGARLSHHTATGSFLTFEVNPSYSFRDVLIYGSLSSGFNTPSLYQLYDPSRGISAYSTRGNSLLDPERSVSFEIGLKKEFSSSSHVTFSAYHTKVSDAIEYVYLWNGATPLEELTFADDRGSMYLNAGEQRVSGVEAEGLVKITSALSLTANISFLNTCIRVDEDDIRAELTGGNHVQLYNFGSFLAGGITQHDAVRRPNFTAFSRVNYHVAPRWNTAVIYRYTGKRFDATYDGSLGPYGALARLNVEAYHLVDMEVSMQATKALGIALKVENVLDEKYREVAGFHTRGRSVYLKLTAQW